MHGKITGVILVTSIRAGRETKSDLKQTHECARVKALFYGNIGKFFRISEKFSEADIS